MIGGIVEIVEEGRHLSLFRGFLKVSENEPKNGPKNKGEIGRVPLDDITTLLISGRGTTLSANLITALAERGAAIVTLGRNWHPKTLTLPIDGHHFMAGILRDQIDLSKPRAKRLWQQVVTEKIINQNKILKWNGDNVAKIKELDNLAARVKSGDPDNLEAQAARHYWPALMGGDFRRDTAAPGINSHLNYGYAILRAATARAVVSAGLTAALGIHHRNQYNSFALVDDLMEPYRPLIDHRVRKMLDGKEGDHVQLTVDAKRDLAATLQQDLPGTKGMSPLVNCLQSLAHSFVTCLSDTSAKLVFAPLPDRQELFQ